MTTAYTGPNVEDMTGLALKVDQLIDVNGVAVNVVDLSTGLLTSGTQTVAGVKTFSSAPVLSGASITAATVPAASLASIGQKMPRATLAATGTNLSTAAQLAANGFTSVTAADGTVGVKLPATPAAGTWVMVKSVTGGSVLKVYPDASATINAIGSNGSISMASLTSAIFIADSTTQWYTIPLLPS